MEIIVVTIFEDKEINIIKGYKVGSADTKKCHCQSQANVGIKDMGTTASTQCNA